MDQTLPVLYRAIARCDGFDGFRTCPEIVIYQVREDPADVESARDPYERFRPLALTHFREQGWLASDDPESLCYCPRHARMI